MADRASSGSGPVSSSRVEAGARRRRRASLRSRITVAAVSAVALTLGLFTLVFALVQGAVLTDAPARPRAPTSSGPCRR
nr:hypothetical protein GCM10025699_40320 [Microbacterium flavescens]